MKFRGAYTLRKGSGIAPTGGDLLSIEGGRVINVRRKARVLRGSASAVVLLTWVLLWLIQDVPVVCNGVQICSGPEVRIAPALSFGAALLIPWAVILLQTRRRRLDPDLPVMWVVFAALVLLALVGLFWALFSGGFGVSTWILELVPRVLVILGLGVLIWRLLLRRRRIGLLDQQSNLPS